MKSIKRKIRWTMYTTLILLLTACEKKRRSRTKARYLHTAGL